MVQDSCMPLSCAFSGLPDEAIRSRALGPTGDDINPSHNLMDPKLWELCYILVYSYDG